MTKLKKDHRIFMKDKTVEYVTQFLYQQIMKDSTNPVNKTFIVNNKQLRFENILKMEPPLERGLNQIDRMIKDQTPDRRLRALRSMAKGLKKYIASDRFKGSDEPEKLLQIMRVSYKKNQKLLKS